MRIRRLDAGIAHAETLVKVWLQYRNAFQAARQAEAAGPAEQEEFARIAQALLIQYRSCKPLLAKAKLADRKVIGRSLHSANLERIVEMPEGLFARFEKDWQRGYQVLKELVDFLQVYRLALLEMPGWQYGIQMVTDSRYVRIAVLTVALGVGIWALDRCGGLGIPSRTAPSIQVVRAVGLVEATGPSNTYWRRLRKGDTVAAGDTIRSGLGAFADLRPDRHTVIRMEPCAELAIEQLGPNGQSTCTLELRLLHGRVRLAASEALEGREVLVRTPDAAVRIAGEEAIAEVSYTAKHGSAAAVHKGQMELLGPLERSCALRAKQHTRIRDEQIEPPQPLPDHEVDVGLATARSMHDDTAQLVQIVQAIAAECRDRGQQWEAFEAYEQVVTLDPARAPAHVAYQQLGEAVGQRYALIDQCRRRADGSPSNLTLQYAYGRIVEDPRERKARYQKALAQDENFYWAHVGMADVFLHERRYADAVATCERAIALDPSLPAGHLKLAEVYLRTGKREEAVAEVRKVTQEHPDRPEAWCELGDFYQRLRRPEPARQAWLEAVKLDPLHARAVLAMAVGVSSLAGQEQRKAALDWCDQALAIAPSNLDVRAWLADRRGCLWRGRHAKRALAEARRLVEQWPENYRAHETLAAVYYGIRFDALDYNVKELAPGELDLPALCEEALQKAKALEPRARSVRHKLADLYAAIGQHEKALAELRAAAKLNPWDPTPCAKTGDSYQTTNGAYFTKEAEQAYQEALKRDPFHTPAWLGLLSLCRLRGAAALTQKRLDEWLKLDPYSAPALAAAHRFYRDVARDSARSEELLRRWERLCPRAGHEARLAGHVHKRQYPEAIALAKTLLAQERTDAACQLAAQAYRQDGQPTQALEQAKARAAEAGGLRAQLSLAREYQAQRRLDEALSAYAAAIEMNPYCAAARRELAELQQRSGHLDKARQTLEACAQWSGDAQDALRVAAICEGQKRYDDAERWAEQARAAGVLAAYSWIASFYMRRGKQENDVQTYQARAVQALDQLIERRPQSAAAWLDYGDFMQTWLKDSAQALQAYRTAAELDPALCAAWRGVGRESSAAPDQAAEAFKRAVDLHPYSGKDRFAYGQQLQRMGRHREAIAQFAQAASTWKHWPVLMYRAMAHQALKDSEGMLETARQMVQEFPKTAQSWHWLGKAYERQGHDSAKAIDALEKAMALGLEGRDRQQAAHTIAALKAQSEGEAERERVAPYIAFLNNVRRAMATLDVQAALALCTQAAGEPALRPFAQRIEQEKGHVLLARAAWDAAAEAAVGRGREVKLRRGTIVAGDVAPGPSPLKLVIATPAGKRLLCPLERVHPSVLVAWAREGLPAGDPLAPVKLALIWYYSGAEYAEQARRELEHAEPAHKRFLAEKLAYTSNGQAPER